MAFLQSWDILHDQFMNFLFSYRPIISHLTRLTTELAPSCGLKRCHVNDVMSPKFCSTLCSSTLFDAVKPPSERLVLFRCGAQKHCTSLTKRQPLFDWMHFMFVFNKIKDSLPVTLFPEETWQAGVWQECHLVSVMPKFSFRFLGGQNAEGGSWTCLRFCSISR